MGAWSENNFGNDTAGDWLWELEGSKNSEVLLRPLIQVLDETEYLESTVCCEALAAAEIIAAGYADDTSSIPENAKTWLLKKRGVFRRSLKITKDHAELAKNVVEKILTDSELKELWEESDSYVDWQAVQSSLLVKLKDA